MNKEKRIQQIKEQIEKARDTLIEMRHPGLEESYFDGLHEKYNSEMKVLNELWADLFDRPFAMEYAFDENDTSGLQEIYKEFFTQFDTTWEQVEARGRLLVPKANEKGLIEKESFSAEERGLVLIAQKGSVKLNEEEQKKLVEIQRKMRQNESLILTKGSEFQKETGEYQVQNTKGPKNAMGRRVRAAAGAALLAATLLLGLGHHAVKDLNGGKANAGYVQQIDELQQQIADLQNQLANASDPNEIANLKQQIALLQNQLQNSVSKDEYNKVEGENAQLNTIIDGLYEKATGEKPDKNLTLEEKKQAILSELGFASTEELRATLKTYYDEKEIDSMSDAEVLTKAVAVINDFASKYEEAITELQEAKQTISDLKIQLENAGTPEAEQILREKLKEAEEALKAAEEKIKNMVSKEDYDAIVALYDAEVKKYETLTEKYAGVISSNTALQSQVANLQSQVNSYKTKWETAVEEKVAVESALKLAKEEIQRLQAIVDSGTASPEELANAYAKIKELEGIITGLESSNAAKDEEIAGYIIRISTITSELEAVLEANTQLEGDSTALNSLYTYFVGGNPAGLTGEQKKEAIKSVLKKMDVELAILIYDSLCQSYGCDVVNSWSDDEYLTHVKNMLEELGLESTDPGDTPPSNDNAHEETEKDSENESGGSSQDQETDSDKVVSDIPGDGYYENGPGK